MPDITHLAAEAPAVSRVAYHIVDNRKNRISYCQTSGRPGFCMAGQTNGSGQVSQEFLLRQAAESSGSHIPDAHTHQQKTTFHRECLSDDYSKI